jgi:Na+/serine symporter
MSENEDAYKEASQITKYEILDKLLKSISVSFVTGSLAAMVGALAGNHELPYALIASSATFMYTKPENLAQVFRDNLSNTLRKYIRK